MPVETQGQLVLAQNQHAFIQDKTKGTVAVNAGPYSSGLSPNDQPVVYDRATDTFKPVSLGEAITQNPLAPEGHYIVLDNPAFRTTGSGPGATASLDHPKQGANSPINLEVGRKINLPGPTTFPLWPGQVAQVIPGHHLRSNQYLVVRVYNAEQANANRPTFIETDNDAPLTPGQLIVIQGTEVNFFIPPTGFEVLKGDDGKFVREALTLERLEYCILLDEDGNKRYERGPAVVFPEATERFVTKNDSVDGNRRDTIKFKALELNPQMGLYIKVIADYKEDDGTERTTGEELFITGATQQIYYPRPEHALIEYDDPNKGGFKRQRYYGITIPKGEGRYVLYKDQGDIKKVTGPRIFLPDPRNQVIVRRVLDDKTVGLWYPGNQEALNFNQSLRALTEESTGYLADTVVVAAAADLTRGMNRGLTKSATLGGSFEGDTLKRGTKFTPPPMLTLNTKYDGVPTINVFTGYAVQVVDRNGNRRVEVGPTTILLEYDETLEVLELSTGKPKNTDKLLRDVYLRVDHNLVSDIVRVETKDLVTVEFKLSYRVNFLREHKDKWFSVENYVKYLCDHMRSMLKGAMKKHGVSDIMQNSAAFIRDTILGTKVEGETRHRLFEENGMDVYDVEVLGVAIADEKIANILKTAQTEAVQSAITLAAEEQTLVNTKRKTAIEREISDLRTAVQVHTQTNSQKVTAAEAATTMAELEAEIAEQSARQVAEVASQENTNAVAEAALNRRKAEDEQTLTVETKRTELFADRMAAITPNLIQALTTLGETEFASKLSTAIAPLAIKEQQGIITTLEQVFKGTPIENIVNNLSRKQTAGN